MEIIKSLNNPKIKYWYQLKSKKGREIEGLYLIEGTKLINEAINAHAKIEQILIDETIYHEGKFDKTMIETQPVIIVSKTVLNKLSETENPQGIIAVVKKSNINIDNILSQKFNFLLLIDEIQDPGNLGTIIRSADAAEVDSIILGKGTVELYNPKVIRSAMGSIFHLPIIEAELSDVIPLLKKNNFKIIGTSPYAEQNYFNIDLTDKLAIMVGNEAKGLSMNRMNQTNQMVKIPIYGQAESLNVAMATTLILFERVRQLKQFTIDS